MQKFREFGKLQIMLEQSNTRKATVFVWYSSSSIQIDWVEALIINIKDVDINRRVTKYAPKFVSFKYALAES